MINIEKKTNRSMADSKIEINQKYSEATMIGMVANSKLQPVFEPGDLLFFLMVDFNLSF